jgi:hypothetical protein
MGEFQHLLGYELRHLIPARAGRTLRGRAYRAANQEFNRGPAGDSRLRES